MGKKSFKIQILISAFIIAAFSSMGALMYAGGSVHFSQFLSEGDICELSQADLRTSSRTMLYNAQYQRYDLTGKVCKKIYPDRDRRKLEICMCDDHKYVRSFDRRICRLL